MPHKRPKLFSSLTCCLGCRHDVGDDFVVFTHRKTKSQLIGADKIPNDFRRYGTPKFCKHLSSFLWDSQVAQQISALASILYLQLGWRATISWKLLSPNSTFDQYKFNAQSMEAHELRVQGMGGSPQALFYIFINFLQNMKFSILILYSKSVLEFKIIFLSFRKLRVRFPI